eukprot:Opistho-2@37893
MVFPFFSCCCSSHSDSLGVAIAITVSSSTAESPLSTVVMLYGCASREATITCPMDDSRSADPPFSLTTSLWLPKGGMSTSVHDDVRREESGDPSAASAWAASACLWVVEGDKRAISRISMPVPWPAWSIASLDAGRLASSQPTADRMADAAPIAKFATSKPIPLPFSWTSPSLCPACTAPMLSRNERAMWLCFSGRSSKRGFPMLSRDLFSAGMLIDLTIMDDLRVQSSDGFAPYGLFDSHIGTLTRGTFQCDAADVSPSLKGKNAACESMTSPADRERMDVLLLVRTMARSPSSLTAGSASREPGEPPSTASQAFLLREGVFGW